MYGALYRLAIIITMVCRCVLCSQNFDFSQPLGVFESSINKKQYKVEVFNPNNSPPCELDNVIYLITCKSCSAQYVGITTTPLKRRVSQYRSNCKREKGATKVCRHFTSKECGNFMANAKFRIMERLPVSELRGRENYWINELETSFPNGLNVQVSSKKPQRRREKESWLSIPIEKKEEEEERGAIGWSQHIRGEGRPLKGEEVCLPKRRGEGGRRRSMNDKIWPIPIQEERGAIGWSQYGEGRSLEEEESLQKRRGKASIKTPLQKRGGRTSMNDKMWAKPVQEEEEEDVRGNNYYYYHQNETVTTTTTMMTTTGEEKVVSPSLPRAVKPKNPERRRRRRRETTTTTTTIEDEEKGEDEREKGKGSITTTTVTEGENINNTDEYYYINSVINTLKNFRFM